MALEQVLRVRVQSASITFFPGRAASRARFPKKGAVAQLGERLICIQEVAGSIPTSSTKLVHKLVHKLVQTTLGLNRGVEPQRRACSSVG